MCTPNEICIQLAGSGQFSTPISGPWWLTLGFALNRGCSKSRNASRTSFCGPIVSPVVLCKSVDAHFLDRPERPLVMFKMRDDSL